MRLRSAAAFCTYKFSPNINKCIINCKTPRPIVIPPSLPELPAISASVDQNNDYKTYSRQRKPSVQLQIRLSSCSSLLLHICSGVSSLFSTLQSLMMGLSLKLYLQMLSRLLYPFCVLRLAEIV